ncbi:hypothetical protein ACFE04_002884 [Oxalis oulophora]
MEAASLVYPCLSIFIFLLTLKFLISTTTKRRRVNLPPSPPGLPFLGHLHLIKEPLHRTLHAFTQKLGPIYSLRFGSRLVLVVSSPSGVAQCLNRNDLIFANRPLLTVGKYVGYDHTVMSLAPYGDHWRNLRRLASLEIFSSHRLNISLSIRRDEIMILIRKLNEISYSGFAKVELKTLFAELSFNMLTRMVAGKLVSRGADQFRELIAEIFEVSGAAFPGDFIPILKWLDYTVNLKKMKKLSKKVDPFLQSMVDEQRKNMGDDNMIVHLLSMQESQPEYYTDEIIKGLIEVMIVAGTDTTSDTLEWAMASLLNHPDILRKARDELDVQLGEELITEQDISKLPYLQNIISETLRLYPAGPLLVPHCSSEDCVIGGYDIPRGTMLLVNAWAVQRDENYWENATSFRPERFETGGESSEGGSKMLPFGLGRRACPGAGLANRVLVLALGSLVQCFEWERIDDKEIDMTEGYGLTMPKVEPLEALCKSSPIISKFIGPLKTN